MTLALIGFAIVLLLAFYGVPLGFSMLAVGVTLFAWIRGWEPALFNNAWSQPAGERRAQKEEALDDAK